MGGTTIALEQKKTKALSNYIQRELFYLGDLD